MKVYPSDEKKSVDLRLLYDILRGLKALCDILTELQMFLNEGINYNVQIEVNRPTYTKVFWVRRNSMNHEVCNLYICLFQL